MRIDIITVLPELLENFTQESIVGRAQKKGLVEIHIHNNNGLQDQHLSIADGTADYSKIVPVLKKIGFDGLVNIETTPTIHGIFGEEADKILLADRDLWRELWKSH